jgi:hypothetical protein
MKVDRVKIAILKAFETTMLNKGIKNLIRREYPTQGYIINGKFMHDETIVKGMKKRATK